MYTYIYTHLVPSLYNRIRGLDIADVLKDLRDLAAQKEHDQVAIVDCMCKDKCSYKRAKSSTMKKEKTELHKDEKD